MKKNILTLSLLSAILFSACEIPKNVVYFQDIQSNEVIECVDGGFVRVKPGDEISIIVSSKDPELAAIFNLFEQRASMSAGSSSQTMDSYGYTINSSGCIDFPVLGEIYIQGMRKEEIASFIKGQLIEKDLISDPVVTVNFKNLQFSVIGDISKPGQYPISKDRTSILEALSMAGDLNITGQRENVLLTRDEGNTKMAYHVNLLSKDIFNSPAYYVQQNDLIYISPNDKAINESTINANTVRSTSFWISLTSLFTAITVLLTND